MQGIRTFCIITVALFLSVSPTLYAQNICAQCDRIAKSHNYYSAYSEGISLDQAIELAKSTISKQIAAVTVSNIEIKDSLSTKNRNGKESYDLSQKATTNIKSYSSVIFQDVDYVELSPEPECKVFVYVAKDKVKNVFEERKNQVNDFVASGKRAEQKLQIDDALRFYYWALMLAKSLPDNVYIEIGGQRGNAISLLPSKIRSVFNNMECSVTDAATNDYGEQVVALKFMYSGNPVASLRYKYFNGMSSAGPVTAKDGKGEAVLVDNIPDGKIEISYEYRFADEAKQLVPDVLENIEPVVFMESRTTFPLAKGTKPLASKKAVEVEPERIEQVQTLSIDKVQDTKPYLDAMTAIEAAIRKKDPKLAYAYMTPECYQLFNQLLTKTGTVTLTKQDGYEFIPANDQILGRFMRVRLKVAGRRDEFMDKLVFRFSPLDHKIQSFAFGLTEKAESDIFDAAKKWSSISRFTILNFMEDYQTAFALKRLDYIEKIFSDDALIIVGRELKSVATAPGDGISGTIGDRKRYNYTMHNKETYLRHLKGVFKSNPYVHLTFEDNTTTTLNTGGRRPDGTAFGIQIKQMYNSSKYSDRGYLTLMLRMDTEYPMIVVRYWQPQKEEIIDMETFYNKNNFEW